MPSGLEDPAAQWSAFGFFVLVPVPLGHAQADLVRFRLVVELAKPQNAMQILQVLVQALELYQAIELQEM